MGIDCYLIWDDQTEEEQKSQYTSFSIQHGHVGYLREAYHGGPYAIKVLAPEAWKEEEATIPVDILRARLPEAIQACKERHFKNYGEDENAEAVQWAVRSLEEFVQLAEAKDREGKKPRIHVSA